MINYIKSLAPRCLYSVVVYVSLIGVLCGKGGAAIVLLIVAISKIADDVVLEYKQIRTDSEKDRLSKLESEVKQLNLAMSFKNMHK